MVELGDLVKDSVSGFKGVAVSQHSYLQGCERITVQPPVDKSGKHLDSCTFDEPQLVIVKKNKIKHGGKSRGGVEKYADEGKLF